MKRFKKTYAIFHLTEKHTVFFLGKTKVHVSFTGGQVTKKGVTPATYTTDDPIVQLAIEKSADFKKGAITLKSKYPLQGEVKIGKNEPEAYTVTELIRQASVAPVDRQTPEDKQAQKTPKDDPSLDDKTAGTPDAEKEAGGASDTEPVEEDATEDKSTPAETPEDKPTPAEAPEDKPAVKNESGLEVIEVSCKDVAKQYLQEHFGEKPSPLRTIADVQECAAKYGITFLFV